MCVRFGPALDGRGGVAITMCIPMPPPDVVEEYGAIPLACGATINGSRFYRQGFTGTYITVQRLAGAFAILFSVFVFALTAAASAQTVPYCQITTYNSTSSDPTCFAFVDSYLLDGLTTTQACPCARPSSSKSCVSNPSTWAPVPLSAYGGNPPADLNGAAAAMQPLAGAAVVLVLFSFALLTCGICPTTTMRVPGGPSPCNVAFVMNVLFASQAAAIALLGSAMGAFDRRVFAPLAANTTALTLTSLTGPSSSLPQPAALAKGGGYNVAIAALVLMCVPPLLMCLAARCAPRWYDGTRAQYYAERLQALGLTSGVPQMQAQVPYGAIAAAPAGYYGQPVALQPMPIGAGGYAQPPMAYPQALPMAGQQVGYVQPAVYYPQPQGYPQQQHVQRQQSYY